MAGFPKCLSSQIIRTIETNQMKICDFQIGWFCTNPCECFGQIHDNGFLQICAQNRQNVENWFPFLLCLKVQGNYKLSLQSIQNSLTFPEEKEKKSHHLTFKGNMHHCLCCIVSKETAKRTNLSTHNTFSLPSLYLLFLLTSPSLYPHITICQQISHKYYKDREIWVRAMRR